MVNSVASLFSSSIFRQHTCEFWALWSLILNSRPWTLVVWFESVDFGRSSASFTFGVSKTFILDRAKQSQDLEGESLGHWTMDNSWTTGGQLVRELGGHIGGQFGQHGGQLGRELGGQLGGQLGQLLGGILNHLDNSFCVSLSVRSFSRKSATWTNTDVY